MVPAAYEVTMAAPKEEPPLAAKLRTAYEQLTGGRRGDGTPGLAGSLRKIGVVESIKLC